MFRADWNVWFVVLDDLPTSRVIVVPVVAVIGIAVSFDLSRFCVIPLATADTNVWVSVLVDGVLSRTCKVKFVPSTTVTFCHWPEMGSVDLGYVFSAAAPLAPLYPQLNVSESSAILTQSPVLIPWAAVVVIFIIPVVGLYVVPVVAVWTSIKARGYGCSVA